MYSGVLVGLLSALVNVTFIFAKTHMLQKLVGGICLLVNIRNVCQLSQFAVKANIHSRTEQTRHFVFRHVHKLHRLTIHANLNYKYLELCIFC